MSQAAKHEEVISKQINMTLSLCRDYYNVVATSPSFTQVHSIVRNYQDSISSKILVRVRCSKKLAESLSFTIRFHRPLVSFG